MLVSHEWRTYNSKYTEPAQLPSKQATSWKSVTSNTMRSRYLTVISLRRTREDELWSVFLLVQGLVFILPLSLACCMRCRVISIPQHIEIRLYVHMVRVLIAQISIIYDHLNCCEKLCTHIPRGRVTHICVGKLTTIGSENGLSPGRRQAIIWTNAGKLLIVL